MTTKKLEKTYIDAARYESIINEVKARQEEQGGVALVITPQKGFIKISAATGRNLYVAATNRVARVDISGFTMDASGGDVITLGEKGSPMDAFGAVEQCLNTYRGQTPEAEEAVLASFRKVLEHMLTLEPVVKQTKAAKEKAGRPAVQGWSREVSGKPEAPVRLTPAQKAERKKQLMALAKEKGVDVSPNAFADASTEMVNASLALAGQG